MPPLPMAPRAHRGPRQPHPVVHRHACSAPPTMRFRAPASSAMRRASRHSGSGSTGTWISSFRQPEQDTFWYLLHGPGKPRGRRPNEPRPRILVTLLDEDPEYRAYFQRVWTEVMNHVLTPAFPERTLRPLSLPRPTPRHRRPRYLAPLKEFLATASRDRLADRHRLAADRTRRHVPHRRDARRGDHRRPSRRAGMAGVLLSRHAGGAVGATGTDVGFSHWVVNGAESMARVLTLDATSPLDIEPIWTQATTLSQAP